MGGVASRGVGGQGCVMGRQQGSQQRCLLRLIHRVRQPLHHLLHLRVPLGTVTRGLTCTSQCCSKSGKAALRDNSPEPPHQCQMATEQGPALTVQDDASTQTLRAALARA